jgi:hypothetical protein
LENPRCSLFLSLSLCSSGIRAAALSLISARMCFSKMLLLQQTQIAALIVLTVPKTCEVNEKISKRRTYRQTDTHTPCL